MQYNIHQAWMVPCTIRRVYNFFFPVAQVCELWLWAILMHMSKSYSIFLEVYKCGKDMSETMTYHESTINAVEYFILLCAYSLFFFTNPPTY